MATMIIVNGQPGVGKSTLLKRLSTELRIGYIAKDSLKELLGDTLYVKNESIDPYYYGDASASALYTVLRSFVPSDKIMFVENAFWYDLAMPRFVDLVRENNTKLIQIYVTCDYEEMVRRFNDRLSSGERHHIHPDTVYVENSVEANTLKYRELDMPGLETYVINTTRGNDQEYQTMKDWLVKQIGETS